ncbi:MAG: DedA family protein [Cyanobacteria bacterium Co-bin8]|nr:DedA family protein [Cyanobacteria bacterium Co-bin8]
MLDWITRIVETLGYWGILALMFLENVLPPIPSEVVMPLSGFAASQSDLKFWLVVAAGAAGSVAGTLPWYFVGKYVGQERLMHWADRHGHWLAISSKDISKATNWFNHRQGYWVVLLARMVPGIRTYVSIPAGISRMRLLPYLAYSLVGTVIWVSGLAIAGYFLGSHYDVVSRYIRPVSVVVILGMLGFSIGWVLLRKRKASH